MAAVLLFAAGTVTVLAGMGSGDLALALAGGATAAAGLVILLAGEWVDPLVALSLSLPLPALYAAGGLRLAPALPLTALVVAGWIAASPARPGPLRTARLPMGWIVLFLVVFAGTALLSPHRGAGAREVANMGILLALLVVAADLIARRPERVDSLAWSLATVAGITGALAVLETVGVLPGRFPGTGGLNRAALGFGQPNGLGMYLAMSLPFALHVRRVAKRPSVRWIAAAAAGATVAGLVATFSRGAWMSVLAGTAAVAVAGRWREALRIWGVALLLAVGSDVVTGGAIRDALFELFQDWSVTQRASLMLAGVRMFLQHPLVGVGPGGYPLELERIGALVPALWDLKDTPHNAYVQMAAETGLVGLAAFMALLWALFRRCLQAVRSSPGDLAASSLRMALLWAFGIALVEGLVEWPFSHGHGQLVILAAAMACALPGVEAEGRGR
jgi:putative inorganic carbon (hco3(-)) transporter